MTVLAQPLLQVAKAAPPDSSQTVIFGQRVKLHCKDGGVVTARQLRDVRTIYEPFFASRAIPTSGVCLDIGAGTGYFALPFAQAFTNWMVVCIEPDAEHFATLTQEVALLGLTNVVCINAAFHPDNSDGEPTARDKILRGEVRMRPADFRRLLALPAKLAPVSAGNGRAGDIVTRPSLPVRLARDLAPDLVRLDAPGCEAAIAEALRDSPTRFIVGLVYPYIPSRAFAPSVLAGNREFYLVHGEHVLRRDFEDNFATRRPGLDIVVAMFNTCHFIQDCVDSLLADGNPDLRVLVVDDGSTDGSGALVDQLYRDNPRVQLLHKANGGCASARNYGRSASNASHIAFVDADDRVDPGMFSALLEAARYTGALVAEAEFKTFTTDANGTDTFGPSSEADLYTRPGQHRLGEFDYDWIPGRQIVVGQPAIWRRVHRRDFLDRKKIWFPEHVRAFDDQIFQLYVGSYAGTILHLRNQFYHYRQHTAQDIKQGDERHFYSFNMFRAVIQRALDEGWKDTSAIMQSLLNTMNWSYGRLRDDLKPVYAAAAVEFLAVVNKTIDGAFEPEFPLRSDIPGLDYLVSRRIQEMGAIPANYAMMRLESWRWQPEFIRMMQASKRQ